ncbi:MAG: M48 family metalloprotease [Terracidiphilus sp.]|jgi:predicted Zn-dependent protease
MDSLENGGFAMTVWNRREWLQKAGMGAAAVTLAPSRLIAGLLAEEPHITVSPLNKLSDEDEIELGRRFAAQLEREQPAISNVLIDRYLGGVVAKLAAQSQRPDLPYSIKLVNSHVPNALSLPGGFLYVNRGLIELIASEDELAAALGHEIGHVVGRHVVNQLLLSFAARSVLKPVLDNLDKQNGVIEKIILQFGGAVAMLAMLHFNRRDEAAADLLGFYEMLRAGWDPNGFLKLFGRLEALEKSSGGTPIPFLLDHPPTPERAAAIRHELTEVKVPAGAVSDSVKFQIFKSAMGLLPQPPKKPEGGEAGTQER